MGCGQGSGETKEVVQETVSRSLRIARAGASVVALLLASAAPVTPKTGDPLSPGSVGKQEWQTAFSTLYSWVHRALKSNKETLAFHVSRLTQNKYSQVHHPRAFDF